MEVRRLKYFNSVSMIFLFYFLWLKVLIELWIFRHIKSKAWWTSLTEKFFLFFEKFRQQNTNRVIGELGVHSSPFFSGVFPFRVYTFVCVKTWAQSLILFTDERNIYIFWKVLCLINMIFSSVCRLFASLFHSPPLQRAHFE